MKFKFLLRDNTIKTIYSNEEIYSSIALIIEENSITNRSLEHYLRAILSQLEVTKSQNGLSIREFINCLNNAFTGTLVDFKDSWREAQNIDIGENCYESTRRSIINQIVDLREMKETGALNNKFLYFGIDSPRGRRWYNFDPCGYIECATAGSLGGWTPVSNTQRVLVPGSLLVMNENGELGTAAPGDISNQINFFEKLNWEDIEYFFAMGQLYE